MFDESFSEAWQLRYGEPARSSVEALRPFLTHRSVRRFKPEPIDEDVVAGLFAAAQSAATSSNLQLWTAVSVQDPWRRNRMALLCDDQRHVRDAAWFLAFFADHRRLRQAAADVGERCEGLDYMEFTTMAIVDAALAAERMVCAAESLGIGICYIGALRNDPAGVQELLALPDGLFGVFGLCLGWPEEPLTAQIKPRLSQAAVWHRETYDDQPPVEEYEERMRAFYESQGMKGNFSWRARSGRRVDEHHLTGREGQKRFLESQGFARR